MPKDTTIDEGIAQSQFFPVDLQAERKANRYLVRSAYSDPKSAENNLAELEPGTLDVDGIPIQVGIQCLQLSGRKAPRWPQKITGIPVDRKAGAVHFLHGCHDAYPGHGAIVATYTMHYADGTEEPFDVISGRHIYDWWSQASPAPQAITCGKFGWSAINTGDSAGFRILLREPKTPPSDPTKIP